MRIVLATNNEGKLREFSAVFANNDCEVLPQSQFAVPEAIEDGLTFIENAIKKARNACFYTNMPAIADDSGLIVDALGGEPGVRSARYAGDSATGDENIAKLLDKMRFISEEKRGARFYCVLVYLRSFYDPAPLISIGVWKGSILSYPLGSYGFGYDPVFFVPEYRCSAAELSLDIKNKISHRGQALVQLLMQLKKSSQTC